MQYGCFSRLTRVAEIMLATLRWRPQSMRRPRHWHTAGLRLQLWHWLLSTAKELTLINDDSLSSAALAMTLCFQPCG